MRKYIQASEDQHTITFDLFEKALPKHRVFEDADEGDAADSRREAADDVAAAATADTLGADSRRLLDIQRLAHILSPMLDPISLQADFGKDAIPTLFQIFGWDCNLPIPQQLEV